MGTLELHVVRLFSITTRSCPAKSHCYHIVAARMAIGVTGNNITKRSLNFDETRDNKTGKTLGRKQPRILDEEHVIPASSDAEEVISAQHDDIPTQDYHNVAAVPEEPEFRDDICYSDFRGTSRRLRDYEYSQ